MCTYQTKSKAYLLSTRRSMSDICYFVKFETASLIGTVVLCAVFILERATKKLMRFFCAIVENYASFLPVRARFDAEGERLVPLY